MKRLVLLAAIAAALVAAIVYFSTPRCMPVSDDWQELRWQDGALCQVSP